MAESLPRIGRYVLLDLIGRGSMGEVYQAHADGDTRLVAVKVMSAELSDDPELIERFRREAVSMSVLKHQNIARVYDHGQDQGRLFMAMELLVGHDLGTLIARQAIPSLKRKIHIMAQCCDGMAFVHACGVVHRDLKPANIHVIRNNQVKILDFGLARIADSVMTQLGTVMGSPSYMSPEVVMGNKADARSDIFSLGAVFYELFAGQRAFQGKGMHNILMAVMSGEPRPLTEFVPELPPAILEIIARCLRKNPDERYADAGELHRDLETNYQA
ncbi:MAG: serine/threonine protein kinase [Vicinamibacteria bacterium]|nr:serine/threonine protein kinase [Vicinamibacteria bacterium]